MDDTLVAILDRCKITNREAVFLIIIIAKNLGYDPESLIVNETSIRRYRDEIRKKQCENIKATFKKERLNATVLHWDGKLLLNFLKREVTDRLPIVVTDGGIEKLIRIPELESGKGLSQAKGIFNNFKTWVLYFINYYILFL